MRFWLLMARLHVLGREAAGVELIGVEIDHHLRPFAAPRLGHAAPLDDAQPLDDEVRRIVEDLLLGQRVAADGDLHDGHARGAVLHDVRRIDAGRHDLQNRLARGRHLGDRGLDPGTGVKVDADDADAEERLALDVLDVVDRGGHAHLRVETAQPWKKHQTFRFFLTWLGRHALMAFGRGGVSLLRVETPGRPSSGRERFVSTPGRPTIRQKSARFRNSLASMGKSFSDCLPGTHTCATMPMS